MVVYTNADAWALYADEGTLDRIEDEYGAEGRGIDFDDMECLWTTNLSQARLWESENVILWPLTEGSKDWKALGIDA